jgi:hypothetical protein
MTSHTPAVVPHGINVPVAALWAVLAGLALIAVLVVGYQVARPATVSPAYPAVTSTWRTDFRHGEIDEGRTGPHADVLQYRAGEIGAATQ